MLNDNSLIDFAYLKSILDVSDSKQTYYEDLINTASQIAEQITKRKLKAQDITEVYDGSGNYYLILPHYPLNSVTSVYVDSERQFTDDTLLLTSDYGVYQDRGIIIQFDNVFPKLPLVVKVVYNAGFTSVPADLQIATVEIVKFLHNRFNNNLVGKKAINLDTGVSETWETSIPLNALQILQRYKKV